MLKYIVVAAAVFSLGMVAQGLGAACAAEMALPGIAPNAASAETDSAMGGARDDAAFGSAMQAATERGADIVRPRPQPVPAAAAAAPGSSGAEASERRHHTHWQSLLPGVMR